jgi:hypothetical protein
MTKETLRILATANGLRRSLAELNALPLPREAEPANFSSLAVPSAADSGR